MITPWLWTVRELARIAGTIGIGQQARYQRSYTQPSPVTR